MRAMFEAFRRVWPSDGVRQRLCVLALRVQVERGPFDSGTLQRLLDGVEAT